MWVCGSDHKWRGETDEQCGMCINTYFGHVVCSIATKIVEFIFQDSEKSMRMHPKCICMNFWAVNIVELVWKIKIGSIAGYFEEERFSIRLNYNKNN